MDFPGLRSCVRGVKPYVPGLTTEEVQRRFGLETIIKLGSNENNYAPFPSALKAMEKELSLTHMYPDVAFKDLKSSLGELYGLGAENIALSHGAEGALQTLGKMFLEPGDEVVIPQVTYGLYREISRVMGARVITVAMEEDLSLSWEKVLEALSSKTKLLWLANPNNPTGRALSRDFFSRLWEHLPPQTLVVLDEAYGEFAGPETLPPTMDLIRQGYPLVAVHTFSKFYGLAGTRLGYVLGDVGLIQSFDVVSEPFNANRVALAGARALLGPGHREVEEVRERIVQDRKRLEEGLLALGCLVVPSQTNFLLCGLPGSGELLGQHLLRRGIIVRTCGMWGLENMIRITVGTSEEVSEFLRVLREILKAFRGGTLTELEEIDVVL